MVTMHSLLDSELVICVGAGGVGKTTTAAALALGAALHQRHAAVITVDPARRLKDALGLEGLSVDPHTVSVNGVGFDALALDVKRTFDAVIQRFAPTADVAERIMANRLYQELSNELAGSAEYMAMEKLHEMSGAEYYDLIVVDTPPSSHVRDLLAAPNRLATLLASRAVNLLQAPGRLLSFADSRMTRMTLSTLLKALQRWTGLDLLRDLGEFASAFEGMTEGFSQRAAEVNELLRSSQTAFVLVTTLEPHTIETTIRFHEQLATEGFRVSGIIANRIVAFPEVEPAAVPADIDPRLRRKLWDNYTDLRELSRRDQRALKRLHRTTGAPLLAAVPVAQEEPTSLAALEVFARQLL
jgi:anion-transporting  ArsA/GET3 family ATPase